MSNLESDTQFIKTLAAELGFLSCGISEATFLDSEAKRLESWLKNDFHGQMQYMENHFDMRLDPRLLVDNAKSVISLTYNYYPSKKQNHDTYKIAKYAYGQDYHHVIKNILKQFHERIIERFGQLSIRYFVDSAPVMDKVWAQKSGLGWIGKNANLITKKQGSFFFIAEIILDKTFIYDQPTTDHCGTCTACIDACPTQAIVQPYVVDAQNCISYFTIELKDAIPNGFQNQFDDWIFGCDICQDVCPWNRFSTPHHQPLFEPQAHWQQFTKQEWQDMTEEIFQVIFKKSAIKRAKYSGLVRNIQYLSKK